MSSDFNFTAMNILIPRKCPRKTPFKTQCPFPLLPLVMQTLFFVNIKFIQIRKEMFLPVFKVDPGREAKVQGSVNSQ